MCCCLKNGRRRARNALSRRRLSQTGALKFQLHTPVQRPCHRLSEELRGSETTRQETRKSEGLLGVNPGVSRTFSTDEGMSCGAPSWCLRLKRVRPYGREARAWRRRHAPAHHGKLARAAKVTHDRCRVVRENTRHRRKVATYRFTEERTDRFLIGGDVVEIAHRRLPRRIVLALVSITMQVP